MLVDLLLLSGLSLGFYLSWRLYQDIFTPLCVYVTVWCVCLLLFHLRIFVDYYSLQPKTAFLFAGSILSFVAGCLLAGRTKPAGAPVAANLRRFELAIKGLTALSFLGLVLFAMRMDSIYGLATYFVDPAILRDDFENWPRIGMLAALVLLNYPLVICCLLHLLQAKKIRWFTCLGFLLACAQSYLLTDRVTVVVFLITGTFLWMYLKGWQRLSPSLLTKLGLAVALTVGYFVTNGNLFGRLVSTSSHQWEMQYLNSYSDLDLMLANPYMYATGPFITMQQAMAKTPDRLWGIRTFFPIARLLYAAEVLEHRPEEASLDFYFVPIPFNTYTYLFSFYEDFGIVGVICFPFILGYLETRLYLSMKSQPTIFSVAGTASFMAVNLFTVFIALSSTILIWYYLAVFYAISRWCSPSPMRRRKVLPASVLCPSQVR